MPILEIAGKQIKFDKMPSDAEIDEVAQQIGGSSKATQDQYLSAGERVKGGFDPNVEQTRATQRTERGLAPKVPLEPVGFNLENLLDLPTDIAEMVGPAFPMIGAGIGGTLAGAGALPTGPGAIGAVAAGGAAGGAIGQFARQRVGEMMGIDQGEIVKQLESMATEGAIGGALQEVGGVAIGRALNATKLGMLNAANKMLKKLSPDEFAKGWGTIASHVDKAKVSFALDAVKRGDKRVLNSMFADKDFADKFARKLFYGEDGNIAAQISRLAHRPEAKGAVADLYNRFLGIEGDTFETIFNEGARINRYNNPNTIVELGNKVATGLDDVIDKAGTSLKHARTRLAKNASNIDVTELTNVNFKLANELSGVGFLLDEGNGIYSINPTYPGTTTGSSQAKIFGNIVKRFFNEVGPGGVPLAGAKKGGHFNINDPSILMDLVGGSEGKVKKRLFSVKNDMKFGDFIGKLASLDTQISGSEFKSVGKLSSPLAGYLEGIRSIPIAVEEKVGGNEVATLTNQFKELAQGAVSLRQGTKVKDVGAIENALKRFANAEPGTAKATEARELNEFLQKNLRVDFLNELRSFKAAKVIQELNGSFGDEALRKKVIAIMSNAIDEGGVEPTVQILKSRIDPFLPEGLRMGELSEVHTVANALHRDAASLLRARFLSNALIGPIAGGALSGPVGATAGLAAGLQLQSLGILRKLIAQSARINPKQIVVKGITPTTMKILQKSPAAGRLLLNQLMQNQ